jgi:multisubunit Na+/H+ antiporter MnhB subunit
MSVAVIGASVVLLFFSFMHYPKVTNWLINLILALPLSAVIALPFLLLLPLRTYYMAKMENQLYVLRHLQDIEIAVPVQEKEHLIQLEPQANR